jgi:hypothetical protein
MTSSQPGGNDISQFVHFVRLRELLQKGNRRTLALASDKPYNVVKTLYCTVQSLEDLRKE